MSIIPPSIIKVYAETLGIANLPDDALSTLSQDLEYRLRELIQDSSKYMVHSRRQKLAVDDVNLALKSRGYDPLYGFEPTEPLAFRSVPNTGIFYIPNEEIDIESVLQEPLPKSPQAMCLSSHWLAIEGVQPSIPQNPTIVDRNVIGEVKEVGGDSTVISGRKEVLEDAEIKPLVKHVLSKELQLYYDSIIADLMDINGNNGQAMNVIEEEGQEFKFSTVTAAAISALKHDAGIQQLLPYFIQFVAEMVPKNLHNLPKLKMLMAVIDALLANEHLFVEPYLHQVMPPTLTCLVGKRLCEDGDEDHWSLRMAAGRIVAKICRVYGKTYGTLLPRVTKTLTKALADPEKPLATHFGAIVGLTGLGPNVIDSIILVNLPDYLMALEPLLEGQEEELEAGVKRDATRVLDALRNAGRTWLAAVRADGELLAAENVEKVQVIGKYLQVTDNDIMSD